MVVVWVVVEKEVGMVEVMEVEEVVFQPGPYSAINKAPPAR